MEEIPNITIIEFKESIQQHERWLTDKNQGKRASFHKKNFRKFNFNNNNPLTDVEFIECIMDESVFEDGIDCSSCSFINSSLQGTIFNGAEMPGSKFEGCKMQEAKFRNTYLFEANFSNGNIATELVDADFSDADLESAQLIGVNLSGSEFLNANLKNAHLSKANMEKTRNVVLDSTWTEGTIFSPWCNERWIQLKRIYTGYRFFLKIAFALIAISPLAVKAFGLTLISYLQSSGIGVGQLTQACPEESCRVVEVWKVLIGWTEASWWPFLMVLFLVTYSIARLLMTFFVAGVKESETLSGRSPPSQQTEWAYSIHRRVIIPLFCLSLAMTAINIWKWKDITVSEPLDLSSISDQKNQFYV